MTLAQYIVVHGDEACSKLFGVSKRTIESWRRGDREPRTDQAREIIKRTNGELSMNDIYPLHNAKDAVTAA